MAARPALERLPYFRFHPADYLIDTNGLTLAEHGVYTLMLLNYYWSGTLPDTASALYSICGARDDVARAAVDLVLARFFHSENGHTIHHRVERELAQYGEMIRTNQAAGRRSAEVRAAKRTLTPKAKPKGNGEDKPADDSFASFWAVYPRHEAKAAAAKAWAKLAPDEALQGRILTAVATQKASQQWQRDGGKYVPHPATWINARRWEDEAAPAQEERFPI